MEAPKTRYSATLATLNTQIVAMPAGDRAKARAAFGKAAQAAVIPPADGAPPGTPPAFDGGKFRFSDVAAALPGAAGAAFSERTAEEIAYRGPQWARLALVPTLQEYLPALADVGDVGDDDKP